MQVGKKILTAVKGMITKMLSRLKNLDFRKKGGKQNNSLEERTKKVPKTVIVGYDSDFPIRVDKNEFPILRPNK